MSVSTAEFLEASYNAAALLGDKAVSSDGTMVIEGFETMTLLIKQFPWPVLTPSGEIEVPGPQGGNTYQPQQLKTAMQGPISLMETVGGQIHDLNDAINAGGGKFQARLYEGTPDKFHYGFKIVGAFWNLDLPDRDYESRSQIMTISGTIFFNFFGKKIPGNIV